VGFSTDESMAEPTRNLVMVYYPGLLNVGDFEEIRDRIRVQAPDIEVFIVPATVPDFSNTRRIANRPSLIFSPMRLGWFQPRRGKVYCGRILPKINQMQTLEKAGIQVPRWTVLTPETKIDPVEWGPVVVLKPAAWRFASGGKGISLIRTAKVKFRECASFPDDHPGRHGPMLVQEFIPTGEHPTKTRIMSLFGEILYALERVSTDKLPDLDAPDETLESYRVVTSGGVQRATLVINQRLIDLARQVFKCFPLVPVQALDVIFDSRDATAYVLEINPGGNTWHFSSQWAAGFETELGGKRLKDQLGAFDIAARVLIERTRREAK
jgi:hypothetical protein